MRIIDFISAMETEIPVETLYEQPVVQELLHKIEKLEFADLEKDVKLPYVIKDKILMSPGVWNGYHYGEQAIKTAFTKSEWDKKEVRSLFSDHEDLRSREWIGEIRNPRMVGSDVVGDLYIIDKPTAMKLAYGAKMGISPKVSGHEEGGSMMSFRFDNFSVVINPAVKTAYINNAQRQEANKTEVSKMADKSEETQPSEAKVKNKDKANQEEEMPKKDKKKYPYPEPEKKMSDVDEELSAYTDFVKSFLKKNPGKSVGDAAKAWEKRKMSETIEMADILEVLNSLKKDVEELKAKGEVKAENSEPAKEEPKSEVKNQEDEGEGEPDNGGDEGKDSEPKEENTEVENSDKNKTIQELSEKVKQMEAKLNEPDKQTVKTEELAQKGDVDEQILAHLKTIGPEVC